MIEDTPSVLAAIIKWLRAEKPESVDAYPVHKIGLPPQQDTDKPVGFLWWL